MKKLSIVTLLVIASSLLVTTQPVLANGSGLGIAGSPHDFSALASNPWNTSEEICRSCHVPHDHQRNLYPAGLLWNHEVTTQTFTTYTSVDGSVAGQPDGVSKLCLGCHDGTVGIDEWDGANVGAGTTFIGSYSQGAQIPGLNNVANLSRTHPLSVAYVYNAADADGLNDPMATPMGSSGMINNVLELGKVQCSSCHDVHDNEASGGTPLLRVSQKSSQGAASGLCLTCHNK